MAGGGGYTPSGPSSGNSGSGDSNGENPSDGENGEEENGEEENGEDSGVENGEIIKFEAQAVPSSIYTFQKGKIEFKPETKIRCGFNGFNSGEYISLNQDTGEFEGKSEPGIANIMVWPVENERLKVPVQINVKKCLVGDIKFINPSNHNLIIEYMEDSYGNPVKGGTITVNLIPEPDDAEPEFITNKKLNWSIGGPNDKETAAILESETTNVTTASNKVKGVCPGVAHLVVEPDDRGSNSGFFRLCNVYVRGIKQIKEIPVLSCGESINLKNYFVFLDKNNSSEKAKFFIENVNFKDILSLKEDGSLTWPNDKYKALDADCSMKLEIDGYRYYFKVHVKS